MKFVVTTNILGVTEVKLHRSSKEKIVKIAYYGMCITAGIAGALYIYKTQSEMPTPE
jgi:hypothetical protein